MMFVGADGVYRYDREKLPEAHQMCQEITEVALMTGTSVVVSNTFTRKWEMQYYYDIAEKCGAKVREITCKGKYQNVHNVPEAVVENMKKRWED